MNAETAFSNTTFTNNNIWQRNPQDELSTGRAQAVRQNSGGWASTHASKQTSAASTQPLKPLSLFVLSSKAGTNSERRSPVSGDDPTSAHSRSNRDSTLLTPNSITSFENYQQANPFQDSRTQRKPVSTARSYQDTNGAWPKEFRPSFVPGQPRSGSGSERDQPLPASTNDVIQSNSFRADTGHNIWDGLSKKHSHLSDVNEFRPVNLPQAVTFDRDGQYVNSKEDELINSFNGMGIGKASYNIPATAYDAFANPKTLSRQTFPQSRKHENGSYSNSWAFDMPLQDQHLHYAGPVGYRSGHDINEPHSTLKGGRYDQTAYAQANSVPSNVVSTKSLELVNQSRSHLTGYDFQPPQCHAGTPYSSSTWPTNTNAPYTFDPAISTSYVVAEPMIERTNESNHVYRSPLLEEFRINKAKKFELKDIYDHIVEFSGDQLGSRFIQQKLEVANSEEKDRVFTEIARDSRQLMTDVFGNYVIQKMFEHGNQSQKKLLASHMKGHIFALSTQTYGCRVVQKALEHILTDQQASLIKELDGCVLKVVENQNGNHVIQKAIERIPGEHVQFIIDAHRGHVHYLSKHAYGCRVIQRMLEHCQPRAKRQVLDELHLNITDLIQDAFGNYVVQHVIANGELQDRKPVIDKVQSRLMENAMHKFASNVVEKALDYAEEEQRRNMLRKLTGRDEHGQSQVIKLLSHQYGNYVIRKSFGLSYFIPANGISERSAAHLYGNALASVIEEMEQYLMQLRRVSTGKQVTSLENSIREARQRLNSQRYENGIHHAPTQPRIALGRR